jgi:hypothetical protein
VSVQKDVVYCREFTVEVHLGREGFSRRSFFRAAFGNPCGHQAAVAEGIGETTASAIADLYRDYRDRERREEEDS